jgi:hypothetical protein
VKIILSSVLALALTAFGARAQTSSKPDSVPTKPSAPSATGEDKGAAGMPNSQSSGSLPGSSSAKTDDTAKPMPAAPSDTKPSDSSASTKTAPAPSDTANLPAPAQNPAASDSAIPGSSTDELAHKKHKKKIRHPEAQGRSGTGSMHHQAPMQDDATGRTDKAGKADQPPVDTTTPPAVTPPANTDQPAAPPADQKK